MNVIGNKWDLILEHEYEQEYFQKIITFLQSEYQQKEIYPPESDIFRALRLTDYDDVKVVILGQDPYPGHGKANGLSFSVNKDVSIPSSLTNIYKELNSDLGINIPTHGDLTTWASQGVLLLNSILTVEKSNPESHKNIGWQIFTDNIIKELNKKDHVVFIFWGLYAKKKASLITNPNNYVIMANHPSSRSAYRGFFGSKPFSQTNDYLKKCKKKEIDWHLD